MTDFDQLVQAYRQQHECMYFKGVAQGQTIFQTTRRQKAFKPRGRTYLRLLMLVTRKFKQ